MLCADIVEINYFKYFGVKKLKQGWRSLAQGQYSRIYNWLNRELEPGCLNTEGMVGVEWEMCGQAERGLMRRRRSNTWCGVTCSFYVTVRRWQHPSVSLTPCRTWDAWFKGLKLGWQRKTMRACHYHLRHGQNTLSTLSRLPRIMLSCFKMCSKAIKYSISLYNFLYLSICTMWIYGVQKLTKCSKS